MPDANAVVTPNDATPTQCQCGRDARIVHCPRCGYATVRAVSSKNHEVLRPDGQLVMLQAYTCRKCALFFDDDDWHLRCQAPYKRGGPPLTQGAALLGPSTVKFDSFDAVPEPLQDAVMQARRMMEQRAKKQSKG